MNKKQRDDARTHSGAFGLAAMFLQIAILLSSIAALMKKKLFWVLVLQEWDWCTSPTDFFSL